MNHQKKANTSSVSQQASQSSLIKETGEIVAEFERLLESEMYLLSTGKTVGMHAIAQAKQTLIERLHAQEKQIIQLIQTDADNPQVVQLKVRLAQCRVDNRSNHSLVMLELKHANKSLDLLRSVLDMNDLSLYSSKGEVHINREQRRLGSA